MSIEKIKIIDSQSQEYTLPKTFELRSQPAVRKSELLDIAFVHGAKDVSDGMFGPRIVEVSGKIWAETDAEYNTKWDALAEHLLKDDIRIQNISRQINVKRVVEIGHEFPSSVGYHYGEVTIRFLALDPFWYGLNVQQKQITITSSPKEWSWDIGGKAETWPSLIRFQMNADNPDFKLENLTDSGRWFRIQDSNNINGTTVEVNCQTGTVIRTPSTNIISKFSGLFLRFLGGRTNNFKYTGSNCVITVQYREAWL